MINLQSGSFERPCSRLNLFGRKVQQALGQHGTAHSGSSRNEYRRYQHFEESSQPLAGQNPHGDEQHDWWSWIGWRSMILNCNCLRWRFQMLLRPRVWKSQTSSYLLCAQRKMEKAPSSLCDFTRHWAHLAKIPQERPHLPLNQHHACRIILSYVFSYSLSMVSSATLIFVNLAKSLPWSFKPCWYPFTSQPTTSATDF